MRTNVQLEPNAPPARTQKRIVDLSRILSGNIEFGSPQDQDGRGVNIDGKWADTTTPGVANTEFTVTHNLDRIPVGVIVVAVDKAAIIYASRKNEWTRSQMFLKCNVATVSFQGFVI